MRTIVFIFKIAYNNELLTDLPSQLDTYNINNVLLCDMLLNYFSSILAFRQLCKYCNNYIIIKIGLRRLQSKHVCPNYVPTQIVTCTFYLHNSIYMYIFTLMTLHIIRYMS